MVYEAEIIDSKEREAIANAYRICFGLFKIFCNYCDYIIINTKNLSCIT